MNQIDSVIYHTHTYTHMSRLTGKTIISEKNMNNTKKFCFRKICMVSRKICFYLFDLDADIETTGDITIFKWIPPFFITFS